MSTYKILQCVTPGPSQGPSFEAWLNKHSANGVEFVGFVPSTDSRAFLAVLRAPNPRAFLDLGSDWPFN